jgi:hypothetical protein
MSFTHELYHSKDKTLKNGKADIHDAEDMSKIIKKFKLESDPKWIKRNSHIFKNKYGEFDVEKIYNYFPNEFRVEKRANKFGLWGTKQYLTDSMRLHKLHPRARVIAGMTAPIRKSVRKLK